MTPRRMHRDEPASSDEGSEAQAEDASTSDADGSNQRDSDVNADEAPPNKMVSFSNRPRVLHGADCPRYTA